MSETTRRETFNCPNCGGPIEYDGQGEKTVRCPYCGTTVAVPEQLIPDRPVVVNFVTPQESYPAATPVKSSRAGCVLIGLIPLVIVIAVLGIVFYTFTQTVNTVTDASRGSISTLQNAARSAVLTQAPASRLTAIARPSPTHAPTPTPSYATSILKFGSAGIGTGMFTDARGVGVDGKGNIYVGEYAGGRIQVFDPQGKFVTQWFAGDAKMLLLGLAVDLKGTVYIADGANITRFDGQTGKNLGKMSYPAGPGFGELATTPDGGLVAMWYQRREGIFTSTDGAREDLVRFDAQGKVTQVIKGVVSSQTDDLSLDNPVAVDGRGNVFVLSTMSGSVFKYTADGKFVNRFGSSGDGPGQFASPQTIAVDGQGNVYIGDIRQVHIFSTDGRFIRSFDVDGVSGFVFNTRDQLVVVDRKQVMAYELGQ